MPSGKRKGKTEGLSDGDTGDSSDDSGESRDGKKLRGERTASSPALCDISPPRDHDGSTYKRKRRKSEPHFAHQDHERDSDNSSDQEESASSGRIAGPAGNKGDAKVDGILQHRWDNMFSRLAAFKERHGHCLVPNRYEGDRSLGAWVSTQRRHYKTKSASAGGDNPDSGASTASTPLTDDRVRRLRDIGFVWATSDPRHTPWEVRFEQLRAYKEQHGNCLVPIGYKGNVQLANWVSTQRQDYKAWKEGRQSRMTPERVQRLSSIGMVWDAQRGGNRQRGRYLSSTTTNDIVTAQDSAAFATEGISPPNSLLSCHFGTTSADPAAGAVGPWLRPTTSSSATVASSNPFWSLRNPLSLTTNLLQDPSALGLLGSLSGIEPTQTDTAIAPQQTRKPQMGLGHSTSDLASRMLHPSSMMESPHVLAALATATNDDQRRAAEQALARAQQEHNRQFASSVTTRRTPVPTAVDNNNDTSLHLAGGETPASIATRSGVDALASRILRETGSLARTASLASASRNQFLSEQHYLSSGVLDPLMLSGLTRVGGIPPSLPGTTLFPYHGMLQTTEGSSSTSNAARRAPADSIRPVPAQLGTTAIPPVGSQRAEEYQQAALLLRAAAQGFSRNSIFDYSEATVSRAAALSRSGHDLLSRQQEEQQVGTMSSRAPAVSENVAMAPDKTRTELSIVDVGSRVAGDEHSKTEPAEEDRSGRKGEVEEKESHSE